MEGTIFEPDPIGLAAAEKFNGIMVHERDILQIKNQLLPTCLDSEQFFELLDLLCFDPATEREHALTILFSPSSQHGSSPARKRQTRRTEVHPIGSHRMNVG
jgi:hypothetical protein